MSELSGPNGHHWAVLLIIGVGVSALAAALLAAWAGILAGFPLLGLGSVALLIAITRLHVLRRFWPAMVEEGYVSSLFLGPLEKGSILADVLWLVGASVLAIWLLDQWADESPLRLAMLGTLVGIAATPLLARIVPKA